MHSRECCSGESTFSSSMLLREAEEVGGGGLGYALGGDAGAELVVVAEDVAEDFEGRNRAGRRIAGDEKVVKIEGVDAGGKVLELGVNFEADEVAADDEEWWVIEGLVVLVELAVGLFEIAAFGFVFPREVAALPDVGIAFVGAADLADTLLKGVAGADLVGLRRMRNSERLAEVTEVLLGSGALGGVCWRSTYGRSSTDRWASCSGY